MNKSGINLANPHAQIDPANLHEQIWQNEVLLSSISSSSLSNSEFKLIQASTDLFKNRNEKESAGTAIVHGEPLMTEQHPKSQLF
jgi:hypothetical protein